MTDLVAAVRDGRVLVRDASSGPVLPVAKPEEGSGHLRALGRAVGVAAVTPLAPPRWLDLDPPLTVHLVDPGTEPDGATWLALDALDELRHPPAVAASVRQGLAEHAGTEPWPARRPPWYRTGWRSAADAWVDQALAQRGLRRAGPSVPLKLWSLSAVLQVAVTDAALGSVYLKAAGGPFVAEASITALLARLAPGAVPDVLALDAARGWLLMRPFPQPTEDGTSAPAAARTLAAIQQSAAAHLDDLLAAGVVDRTAGPTVDALRDVVRGGVERDLLTPAEQQQAVELLPWFAAQVQALVATGMPVTLGHGDLHAGNYTVQDGRVVIFDWTDAALTFPALDAALLARSVGPDHGPAALAAYADAWRAGWPDADVERALDLARVVNLGYQAVSFDGIYRSQEGAARGELAGLSARNLRELIAAWRSGR